MANKSGVVMVTREVVDRINTGDGLTDQELRCAVMFYKGLAVNLRILGPEFKLAGRDVQSTLRALEGFQAARDRA